MDFFDNPYFQINKFFLSSIGQWPYHNSIRKRLIQSLIITALVSCLLPSVTGLYKVWGNLDHMVECLPPIFTAIGCLVYTVVYICKEKKLKSLLEGIKSDWQFWSFGHENEILCSHAEHGRVYTILYTGCISGTTITYAAMTLTPQILNVILPLNETRPKKLPFPVEYFVDSDKYFYWILFHIFITATVEMCVIIGSESVLAVFTEHACGLFTIIGYRLKSVKNIDYSKITSGKEVEDATYKVVTFCIEQHNRIIEFCDTIESCFCVCFFFTMGLNSLLISATLLQVVVNIDRLNDAVRFGAFSAALIIHLYFNSLPAQRMMDHSIILADAMYDGTWYHLPLKPKKLLSIIIMRTSVPCTLTAGKMCVMSLKSFCVDCAWGKVDLMVECLVPIFTVLGCFVYTIVYICKEKKLKSLFDRIESDWQIWSSGQESNILYSHAEDGRFLTILYTGYISLTMILYVAMTLTPQILDIILPLNETRPKKLPFPVEYFFNYDEYFYWILIHIFITATIEICVIIGCESVLAVFTEHVCGLFAIVGHRLRTMKRDINSNEINCQRSLEDIIYKDLTFCIEQHNRAIELY